MSFSILFFILFELPCFGALGSAKNPSLACSKQLQVMPPPTQLVVAVFGGTRIGNRELFMPHTHLETFLTTLTRHYITKIDTAQAYGNSEVTLGRIQAGSRFVIDTKWSPDSWTESSTPWATNERIIRSAEESIYELAVDQVSRNLASPLYKVIFLFHNIDYITIFSLYSAAAANLIQFWPKRLTSSTFIGQTR